MGNAFEYVKKHPWTIAGVIGALIVLYLLFSSSSGGSSAAAGPSGPSDAAIASGTQLQLAGMQLTAQSNQTNAQLAAAENTNAAQVTIAGLNATTAQYQTGKQADVAALNIEAQASTQQIVGAYQLQLGLAQQATATQINAQNTAAYTHLADTQAATTIASYNAQTAQTEAYVNKDVQIAQINAKTAQKKSSNSLIGGIIGGALSIFSDVRLKRNIRTVGYDARGRRWIDFQYIWDNDKITRRGVIAQEIMRSDPDAVSIGAFGFLMVNYGMLQ